MHGYIMKKIYFSVPIPDIQSCSSQFCLLLLVTVSKGSGMSKGSKLLALNYEKLDRQLKFGIDPESCDQFQLFPVSYFHSKHGQIHSTRALDKCSEQPHLVSSHLVSSHLALTQALTLTLTLKPPPTPTFTLTLPLTPNKKTAQKVSKTKDITEFENSTTFIIYAKLISANCVRTRSNNLDLN